MKRMIPGVETLELDHLVLDYNGTLARGGRPIDGVAGRLRALAGELAIHVVTADTFGSVRRELEGLPVTVQVIGAENQGKQKAAFVGSLEGGVCALGNGANDGDMLEAARLGVAVLEGEGLYAPLLARADLVCRSVTEALDLLLDEQALAATLRR